MVHQSSFYFYNPLLFCFYDCHWQWYTINFSSNIWLRSGKVCAANDPFSLILISSFTTLFINEKKIIDMFLFLVIVDVHLLFYVTLVIWQRTIAKVRTVLLQVQWVKFILLDQWCFFVFIAEIFCFAVLPHKIFWILSKKKWETTKSFLFSEIPSLRADARFVKPFDYYWPANHTKVKSNSRSWIEFV